MFQTAQFCWDGSIELVGKEVELPQRRRSLRSDGRPTSDGIDLLQWGAVSSIHPLLLLHFSPPAAMNNLISAPLSSAYFWWVGDEESDDDGFAV
eukprot:12867483-Ditylum_brightwellii.AAC.1